METGVSEHEPRKGTDMKNRRVKSTVGRPFAGLVALSAAVMVLCACCASAPRAFDPKTCMETIPRRIEGLEILQGPRTYQSIVRDMVPVVCNAQVLFRRLKNSGETIHGGSAVFRVAVEYTGEVYHASVEETTIDSKRFLREVADFIMDTDFVGWARNDTDTVFLYPMTFDG
jgi:hypothetical protein